MATGWSCWVENKYETFSVRENHWNFFPGWKTLTYSCRLRDSNPRPPSNSVVAITPRLAHCPNHSATELWMYLGAEGLTTQYWANSDSSIVMIIIQHVTFIKVLGSILCVSVYMDQYLNTHTHVHIVILWMCLSMQERNLSVGLILWSSTFPFHFPH